MRGETWWTEELLFCLKSKLLWLHTELTTCQFLEWHLLYWFLPSLTISHSLSHCLFNVEIVFEILHLSQSLMPSFIYFVLAMGLRLSEWVSMRERGKQSVSVMQLKDYEWFEEDFLYLFFLYLKEFEGILYWLKRLVVSQLSPGSCSCSCAAWKCQ